MSPTENTELRDLVAGALAEDLGTGDVTAEATVPAEARARARIVQKAPGVIAGFDAAAEVFRQTGAGELELRGAEGEWHESDLPVEIAVVEGAARALLAAERTALNFLGHLSGIATLTARFVRASGGSATILDTRKTTPGLRTLEKAAVATGGGANHRMGLYDAILIKENHAALAGGTAAAIEAARAAQPGMPIEIECRDAGEVAAALDAGAERILLDNMSFEELRAAVAARDERRPETTLEASGGVDLEIVGAIAARGVDFISIGALTHSAPNLDLSMLLEPLETPLLEES